MERYLKYYKAYLSNSVASKNTYESYLRDVTQYCEYLSKVRHISKPSDITIEDMRKMLKYEK